MTINNQIYFNMLPSTIQSKTIEMYPTFEKFMTQLRPANLKGMYDDIMTIKQSISELRLSLKDINNIYSDGKSTFPGIDYLKEWLEYLNRFSGINKPLSETLDVAIYLYSDYKHFYLTDLKLIFDMIMRKDGEYGKFYAAIDAQIIISDFARYNRTRVSEQTAEQTEIKKRLDKELDFIFRTKRSIVNEEYKQKFGDQWLEMGRDIYAETSKRAKEEQRIVRAKFLEKYGI